MKHVKIIAPAILFLSTTGVFQSCTKCAECHYEKNGQDIELTGEYCDDEIENIEANGYTDSTGTYPAHCGEH